MIKIEELKNYTIPYCGNKRIFPYGDLVVSDGESRKTCKIKDEGANMPELVKVKPNKQHGNGNDFMNATENVINNSDSQAETGIMCIALAMAGM
ncbi:MAG: hypothetical protein II304_02040 [Bacteroidales bacterium]|nr:hypothetical protein [Bacteroidales bacterium]